MGVNGADSLALGVWDIYKLVTTNGITLKVLAQQLIQKGGASHRQ